MLSRMTTRSRRSVARVLQWINDNPLTTAGITMATLASGYLTALIRGAATEASADVVNLAPLTLSVVSDRPAYLLAIVVGVGTLVWRE